MHSEPPRRLSYYQGRRYTYTPQGNLAMLNRSAGIRYTNGLITGFGARCSQETRVRQTSRSITPHPVRGPTEHGSEDDHNAHQVPSWHGGTWWRDASACWQAGSLECTVPSISGTARQGIRGLGSGVAGHSERSTSVTVPDMVRIRVKLRQ